MTGRTGSTTVFMVSPQGTLQQAFYLACGDASESCSNEKYGEDFSGNRKRVIYGYQKLTKTLKETTLVNSAVIVKHGNPS